MIEINWKQQIFVLWVGQLVLIATTSMSTPFWPLFLKQLNTSNSLLPYWSAAIYSAPLITTIISTPLWAKIGDKIGHKKMVLRAAIGLFVTQGLIALITDPSTIVLFRLLQGVFAGFIAAAQAYAMTITPTFSRGQVMGKLQSSTAVGTLVGPFFGSVIASYFGYRYIFFFSAIACAVTFLYLLVYLQENDVKPITVSVTSAETKTSSGIRKKKPFIKTIGLYFLLIMTSVQTARYMITPFFALFVTEKLGGNNLEVGLLYSATGLTVFLSAPYWGNLLDQLIKQHKNMQVQYILMVILFAAALFQIAMAYTENIYIVLLLRLLWGVCLGGILPILFTLLVHMNGEGEKGAVVGFGQSANKLGQLIGISLGAFAQDIFGFTWSISMIATTYFLLGLIFLGSKPIFTKKVVAHIQDESI